MLLGVVGCYVVECFWVLLDVVGCCWRLLSSVGSCWMLDVVGLLLGVVELLGVALDGVGWGVGV